MEHTSSHTKTRLLESTSGTRCSNAFRNFERVTLSGGVGEFLVKRPVNDAKQVGFL